MKRLIVNADGFGFGAGATQGILDAIDAGGFITSVSVNANFPEAARAAGLAERFPAVSIGVHLNPMVGRPCLPAAAVPSLVGADGCFHEGRFPALLRKGLISRQELKAEFAAQILRMRELVGGRLSHLDSQGNRHLDYFGLFLEVAREAGIERMRNNASLICLEAPQPRRARLRAYAAKPHVWLVHRYRQHQMRRARRAAMRMADGLITVGYAGCGNKTAGDNWLHILSNLPGGTFEIYCHPAYPDGTLQRWATYCGERADELAVLSGPGLRDAAAKAGVQLISFYDL